MELNPRLKIPIALAIGMGAGFAVREVPFRPPISASQPTLIGSALPETKAQGFSSFDTIEKAFNEEDLRKRRRTLQKLLDALEAQEIPDALDALRTKKIPGLFAFELELLTDWAVVDPKAALSYGPALDRVLTGSG